MELETLNMKHETHWVKWLGIACVYAYVYAYVYARLPAYSSDTEMVTVHKDGKKNFRAGLWAG